MKDQNEIAFALREVFFSPNVEDVNGESANIVDALAILARGRSCASTATWGGRGMAVSAHIRVIGNHSSTG